MPKTPAKYRKVKPIAVEYKGINFKSKLEAIWALYFDSLEIEYKYEPDLFWLKYKTKVIGYVPDFYFPKLNIYAEVKPLKFSVLEDRKVQLLVAQSKVNCLKLIAIPSMQYYECITLKDGILGSVKKLFDNSTIVTYSTSALSRIKESQDSLIKELTTKYRKPLL